MDSAGLHMMETLRQSQAELLLWLLHALPAPAVALKTGPARDRFRAFIHIPFLSVMCWRSAASEQTYLIESAAHVS